MNAAKPYQRRKYLFESSFRLMSIFMIMPWPAGDVGVGIGIIAFTTTRKNHTKRVIATVLYTTSLFWLIYTAWEIYNHLIGADIRVDLLIIYPFLFLVTALGLIIWLIGLKRTKFDKQHQHIYRVKPGQASGITHLDKTTANYKRYRVIKRGGLFL